MKVWPLILTGYPLLGLAIYAVRQPKVSSIRMFWWALLAFIISGGVMTLVLIFALIDGASGLDCWNSTLVNGC